MKGVFLVQPLLLLQAVACICQHLLLPAKLPCKILQPLPCCECRGIPSSSYTQGMNPTAGSSLACTVSGQARC